MRWSWRVGEFAGISVYIHATFLLLLGFVALSYWLEQRSLSAVLAGVGFLLLLFLCVVLHEYGHALTARRFGIKTRDITLLPIGGVARLERMPADPRQELWVAIAGPLVNVVIAVGLYLWLALTETWSPLSSLDVTAGPLLERLLVVNVFLVLFNLIPAFPMDGGRVLRALLALRLEYTRATQIAASLGQFIALLFGFLGLFTNPFLVFIAFFVWIGAAQEASMVQMRTALAGLPVKGVMITDFDQLSSTDTLEKGIALTLRGSQKDFPVIDGGRLVGILTQESLLRALSERGPHGRVAEVMVTDFQTAHMDEMVEHAFVRLEGCDCHTIPVLDGDRVGGLLTMDNMGEFLRIQAALKQR